MQRLLLMIFILLLLLYSCGQKNSRKSVLEENHLSTKPTEVEYKVLSKSVFYRQSSASATIEAQRKAKLTFPVSGKLEKTLINGTYVQGGQVIASINDELYQEQLSRSQFQKEKSALTMKDQLLTQGYGLEDTVRVDQNVIRSIRVKSGYSEALLDFQKAQRELKATFLKAPYSGIIANVAFSEYEQINAGEVFCTLMDVRKVYINFSLTEQEIHGIEIGQRLKVIPLTFPEEEFEGELVEINPTVDNNGLIKLKALINNPEKRLWDGMNATVFLEKDIPNQLIVPKSAVLLRQNQEVLFIYKGGIAWWTYVKVLTENSHSYSVMAHPDKGGSLSEGDTVITTGNFSLAHNSNVSLLLK